MTNRPSALIVDDDPDIVEFVKYNLEKVGFSVHTAYNGKKGIEQAYRTQPNVIVLDVMMPEMDGVEVCRHLRLDAIFDRTIITFLTARSEDYSQIAALDVGGDAYITKPIRPRLLVSKINALIRRKQRAVPTEKEGLLKVADLIIDKEKFIILKNNETISLPKKEFEILLLLASRPGKVFSRNEIFNNIWGMDIIVGTRTIDVHIRKLREKIGENVIKTIKGVGYKLLIDAENTAT